jgi:anti-sigma-K factor RskA
MTDDRDIPDAPGDLAAEYALGVLTGDELRRARELERTDPGFRQQVARWSGRLAPMLDEIQPVQPPPAAWAGIRQRLGDPAANDNVSQLRRRVHQWRGVAAAMSAMAACLAIVLVAGLPRPAPEPVEVHRPAAPPLVAMLGDQDRPMKVVASWDPAARQLVLAVAPDMPSDPRHSHELWVIPSDGKPRSLGTMGARKQMHMRLADAVAQLLQQGATIAISVEPPGGSPTGAPTGPVVASGALARA